LNGLDAILPLLLASKSNSPKSIVVTGSKQGITNPPGGNNPAYNASKAAIKSLTEHLAYDLRSDPSTSHISVHLLIPGWTWTGFMGNVGPTKEQDLKKPAGAWYPSQVAEELLTGLEKGSFYIICPDGETDRALDQARMKWGSEDVVEERPALSRWEDGWKGRAEEAIQADANARRG
jgi:NAD(P)-dependent dehydrogenase (short-subunit alcohol dehydrogenase family)